MIGIVLDQQYPVVLHRPEFRRAGAPVKFGTRK
jgi:hypothetical protein